MRNYILLIAFGFLVFGCLNSNQPQLNQTVQINGTVFGCIDGDGGINENISSSLTLSNETLLDSCLDNKTVFENYCDQQNRSASRQIDCGQNRKCENGACIRVEVNVSNKPIPKCLDTDNGKNIYTAGSVTVSNETYADTCQGQYAVLECCCNNETLGQNATNCPNGAQCQRGACVDLERRCQDSDSNEESKAGQVTLYGGGVVIQNVADRCINSNQYTEYYCDGTNVGNRTVSCSDNQYCEGGLCLNKCQKFDSPVSKSYVKTQNQTYYDQCRDSNTLTTWNCEGNSAVSRNINCDGTCLDGKCIDREDLECNNRGSGADIRYRNKIIESKNNTCVDTRTIRYYTCEESQIISGSTRCSSGETCYLGDCIAAPNNSCYDLDQGSTDLNTRSYVVTIDRDGERLEEHDDCFNFQTVIEYTCDGSQSRVEYKNCPQGKSCRDGACR